MDAAQPSRNQTCRNRRQWRTLRGARHRNSRLSVSSVTSCSKVLMLSVLRISRRENEVWTDNGTEERITVLPRLPSYPRYRQSAVAVLCRRNRPNPTDYEPLIEKLLP